MGGPQAAAKLPSMAKRLPNILSPDFLGRSDVLETIANALNQDRGSQPARCVLYGMHGMGKTRAV